MYKLQLGGLLGGSPCPAACQEQQKQQDILTSAASFVGLKIFGEETTAVTEGAAAAAAAAAAGDNKIEIEGTPPPFNSKWERHLAYNYGVYDSRRLHRQLNAAEIQRDASLFKQTLDAVDAKDACKYLQLEEFKCLREHQAHREPEAASTKCVKWFQEWRQCKWDQEKLQKGYSYAEDCEASKHKPYIAAPDYQYS